MARLLHHPLVDSTGKEFVPLAWGNPGANGSLNTTGILFNSPGMVMRDGQLWLATGRIDLPDAKVTLVYSIPKSASGLSFRGRRAEVSDPVGGDKIFFERETMKVITIFFGLLSIFIVAADGIAQTTPTAPKKPTTAPSPSATPADDRPHVTGILIDAVGKVVVGRKLSLLMVTTENGLVPFQMFAPESTTDAKGRFSLRVPKYVMVPDGATLTGYTVGYVQWSGYPNDPPKAIGLKLKETNKLAQIELEPKTKTVEIGNIVSDK